MVVMTFCEICTLVAMQQLSLVAYGHLMGLHHYIALGDVPHVYYVCDTCVIQTLCFGVLHMSFINL